jgi:small subunit ribosomal protein S6
MIREYETTFIVDALLQEDQINATIEKTKNFIEKNGGKIWNIDRWGKRRLAYEIAKKQYGYYIYMRFQFEGSLIKDFEREFKLDDSVLRYLTVLVPKAMLAEEKAEKDKQKTKDTPSEPPEIPADGQASEPPANKKNEIPKTD